MTTILGIGAAHIDRIGRIEGAAIIGASNPGHMIETVGGGLFNVLRVIGALSQMRIKICSARGGDSAGQAIAEAIETADIEDLSGVFLNRTSATYTAIHAREGDVLMALADMDIYESALPRQLRRPSVANAVKTADCVLVDANLPEKALETVARSEPKVLAAMTISAAKAQRLKAIGPHIDYLFCNQQEAEALCGPNKATQSQLVRLFPKASIIVTNGNAPVHWRICADTAWKTVSTAPVAVVDVTGAGDALTGGVLASLLSAPKQNNLHEALIEGIACAQCALAINGPIKGSHDLGAFETHLVAVKEQNQP